MSQSQTYQRASTSFHIDQKEMLPGGRMKLRGRLTKTGIFEYRIGEDTVREKRSEEEVFSKDSLASLEGAYVTIDHPASIPSKDAAVGRVLSVQAKPPYVTGEIQLEDSKAISMVKNNHLTELSCGYHMRLEQDASGEADFVQTQITYDHLAMGPEGWARLGRDVCLRLDSKRNDISFITDDGESMTEKQETPPEPDTRLDSVVEKLDLLASVVNKLAEVQTKEQDSPVVRTEDLPSEEALEVIIGERVDALLALELKARAAHETILGHKQREDGTWERIANYYVKPVLCGKFLCEDVLRTVNITVDSNDTLESLAKEASLLAAQRRIEMDSARSSVTTLQSRFRQSTPATAQKPTSGLRARLQG